VGRGPLDPTEGSLKIEFLCTGKIQKPYLKSAVNDYVKRLQHYLPLSIIELKESPHRDPLQIQAQESKNILKLIDSQNSVIVWDEKGVELSSQEFAAFLEKCQLQGKKKIVMVLGGAYGVSEELRQRAHKVLSLSKMTLPHQLARLVVMEQLYRAMTIIEREPYHHS